MSRSKILAFGIKNLSLLGETLGGALYPRLHTIRQTSTMNEHMPKEHEYVNEKMNPSRLRSWAKNIGEYSTIFVEDAFAAVEHKANAYRQIIAVLSLARIYGETELELALMYALDKRIIKTRSIKSILEKKLYLSEAVNNKIARPSVPNDHGNLRGADEYK